MHLSIGYVLVESNRGTTRPLCNLTRQLQTLYRFLPFLFPYSNLGPLLFAQANSNLLKRMHPCTICENRTTDFPVAPGPIFNADVDRVGAPMRGFRRSMRQLSFIVI